MSDLFGMTAAQLQQELERAEQNERHFRNRAFECRHHQRIRQNMEVEAIKAEIGRLQCKLAAAQDSSSSFMRHPQEQANET